MIEWAEQVISLLFLSKSRFSLLPCPALSCSIPFFLCLLISLILSANPPPLLPRFRACRPAVPFMPAHAPSPSPPHTSSAPSPSSKRSMPSPRGSTTRASSSVRGLCCRRDAPAFLVPPTSASAASPLKWTDSVGEGAGAGGEGCGVRTAQHSSPASAAPVGALVAGSDGVGSASGKSAGAAVVAVAAADNGRLEGRAGSGGSTAGRGLRRLGSGA